jgi:hypothetical protein
MALSNNNRTYYATHAVALGKKDADPTAAITNAASQANTIRAASGVQSVGVNTTFNLEQVFQLGQLEIYENIENIPDVEVTIEKALDGHALIQHLEDRMLSFLVLSFLKTSLEQWELRMEKSEPLVMFTSAAILITPQTQPASFLN